MKDSQDPAAHECNKTAVLPEERLQNGAGGWHADGGRALRGRVVCALATWAESVPLDVLLETEVFPLSKLSNVFVLWQTVVGRLLGRLFRTAIMLRVVRLLFRFTQRMGRLPSAAVSFRCSGSIRIPNARIPKSRLLGTVWQICR